MTDRPAVTLQDMITETLLHAAGLRDFIARFAGTKKRPESEIERARSRLTIVDATVEYLKQSRPS